MPDFRSCMFIDGLDEYEGRPDDIIDKLQHLAEAESVKLCLASHPRTLLVIPRYAVTACETDH